MCTKVAVASIRDLKDNYYLSVKATLVCFRTDVRNHDTHTRVYIIENCYVTWISTEMARYLTGICTTLDNEGEIIYSILS